MTKNDKINILIFQCLQAQKFPRRILAVMESRRRRVTRFVDAYPLAIKHGKWNSRVNGGLCLAIFLI